MNPLEHVIRQFARLPGLGPRSARRLVLKLFTDQERLLMPLLEGLQHARETVSECRQCGNLESDPCTICSDSGRDSRLLCVVESVADLWAVERAGCFKGVYHVLGGVLSPLDGVGPEDLRIEALVARCRQLEGAESEVIMATNVTVDGQTTAYFVGQQLAGLGVKVTRLALGVPVGGELDYLDDGTLLAALDHRKGLMV